MTNKTFRYSSVKALGYTLPFVVIGMFVVVTSESQVAQVGGGTGAAMFALAAVVSLRFRLTVTSTCIELRQLRRSHEVDFSTIGSKQIAAIVGSSSILTMTDTTGHQRAVSLEFFTRSQRRILAATLAEAMSAAGGGRTGRGSASCQPSP